MGFEYTFTTKSTVPVKSLLAELGVRHWEDGEVDGVKDTNGGLIPLRVGDVWRLVIDLETGVISDWPEGVIANVHYKVCDNGSYALLDENGTEWGRRNWYVPSMLAPSGGGFGDYVILKIDGKGQIQNWRADLDFFDEADD